MSRLSRLTSVRKPKQVGKQDSASSRSVLKRKCQRHLLWSKAAETKETTTLSLLRIHQTISAAFHVFQDFNDNKDNKFDDDNNFKHALPLVTHIIFHNGQDQEDSLAQNITQTVADDSLPSPISLQSYKADDDSFVLKSNLANTVTIRKRLSGPYSSSCNAPTKRRRLSRGDAPIAAARINGPRYEKDGSFKFMFGLTDKRIAPSPVAGCYRKPGRSDVSSPQPSIDVETQSTSLMANNRRPNLEWLISHLDRFDSGKWFNDDIINTLTVMRAHKRMARGGNHWVLYHYASSSILYVYDLLGHDVSRDNMTTQEVTSFVFKSLQARSSASFYVLEGPTRQTNHSNLLKIYLQGPIQPNTWDCGVYLIAAASILAEGNTLPDRYDGDVLRQRYRNMYLTNPFSTPAESIWNYSIAHAWRSDPANTTASIHAKTTRKVTAQTQKREPHHEMVDQKHRRRQTHTRMMGETTAPRIVLAAVLAAAAAAAGGHDDRPCLFPSPFPSCFAPGLDLIPLPEHSLGSSDGSLVFVIIAFVAVVVVDAAHGDERLYRELQERAGLLAVQSSRAATNRRLYSQDLQHLLSLRHIIAVNLGIAPTPLGLLDFDDEDALRPCYVATVLEESVHDVVLAAGETARAPLWGRFKGGDAEASCVIRDSILLTDMLLDDAARGELLCYIQPKIGPKVSWKDRAGTVDGFCSKQIASPDIIQPTSRQLLNYFDCSAYKLAAEHALLHATMALPLAPSPLDFGKKVDRRLCCRQMLEYYGWRDDGEVGEEAWVPTWNSGG
ncbi:hypothetical protein LY76DRAFT_610398 [Colletotrichum caudatum]|nr:hypothetical protein LY76DRAFT_610398 [Colletotrichum caudatum]